MASTWLGFAYMLVVVGPLLAYRWQHRRALRTGPKPKTFRDALRACVTHGGMEANLFAPAYATPRHATPQR